MIMERKVYASLIGFVKMQMSKKSTCNIELTCEKFTDIPKKTVGCIVNQEYQRKMKRIHPKFKKFDESEALFRRYNELKSECCENAVDQLVRETGLCESLIARILLSVHESESQSTDDSGASKSHISQLAKDPGMIEDETLSYEVWMASLSDNVYGPISEMIKLELGESHEDLIKYELKNLNIPFVDEHELREEGFDKTPDVKLLIPFMYQGIVINWIESKALFGDDDGHRQYLQNQYWSYLNRFGSGLVIYWFGFIIDLDNNRDRGLMLSDNFPDISNIIKFNPESLIPDLAEECKIELSNKETNM